MITRIDATNYRCFEQLGIDFGPFTVIAGANGSGKTTLLDIPVLFGDLLRSRNVAHAFVGRLLGRGPRATSLTEVPFRSDRDTFTLGIEARLPETIKAALVDASSTSIRNTPEKHPTHIRYELRLALKDGHQLTVKNEYLFVFPHSDSYENNRLPIQGENYDNQDGWRFILQRESYVVPRSGMKVPRFARDWDKTSDVVLRPETSGSKDREAQTDRTITALPRLQYEAETDFAAGRWLLDLLLTRALFFDPTWPDLRRAAPPGLDKTLMSSGENLPWLALALQKTDPERFAWWVGHVQTALPQIADITVHEREDDHHAYFRVVYEGGFAVTSSGLSEGTLRIMALTLVAYLPNAPALLVTEEPENSIHPQAIETIMQSLRSLYDSQAWVSTHSPVVLADSKLSELVITRIDRSGAATAVRGKDHPRLKDWKDALHLGDLFATGVFE